MKFYFKNTAIAALFVFVVLGSQTTLLAQQWDTLADIPIKLAFPVVTVLDGRIHIMGGGGTGGASPAHYAYDPAANTWSTKAPVPYLAQQPAGAAVNGKIHYFGGGYPNSGTPLDDHQIYDPVSNSWTPGADLTAPRAIHYAVDLDGVLYSLAGQGMANLCQTYDAVFNMWNTKNPLPDNSFWYGAHVATGGYMYRFCGGGYTAPVNKAHKYNPGTDSWSALPNFPASVHSISGTAVGDKIYLAGGYFDFLDRDEVWIFDTNTQTYSSGTPLPLGRSYHRLVTIDSCIYSVGGNNAIDANMGKSLIRFCPFQSSAVKAAPEGISPANVCYESGRLLVFLPAAPALKDSRLSVFDTAGRQVFSEQQQADAEGILESFPGAMAPGVYFVQLRMEDALFVGKFIIPSN